MFSPKPTSPAIPPLAPAVEFDTQGIKSCISFSQSLVYPVQALLEQVLQDKNLGPPVGTAIHSNPPNCRLGRSP